MWMMFWHLLVFAECFFVSGLNLTAPRAYIAKNQKESLRTLTFSNWERLREWVEKQKPGSDPDSLNIIAGDFVGPLPLCSLVIALNQKLLPESSTQRGKMYWRVFKNALKFSFPSFFYWMWFFWIISDSKRNHHLLKTKKWPSASLMWNQYIFTKKKL